MLADRCLPISMKRKSKDEKVERPRYRDVEKAGKALYARLETWAAANKDNAADIYNRLEPYPIKNDRLAEGIMTLQTVLLLDCTPYAMEMLNRYVKEVDERPQALSVEEQLLLAIREIYDEKPTDDFLASETLIAHLVKRTEEPWATYKWNKPITPESLAILLRPFKIYSDRPNSKAQKGYYRAMFDEAWERTGTPSKNAAHAALAASRPAGYDAYLKTPGWTVKRGKVKEAWQERWDGCCALCGDDAPLEVHHRRYASKLGDEAITDCVPVCSRCHPHADAARQESMKAKEEAEAAARYAEQQAALKAEMKARIQASKRKRPAVAEQPPAADEPMYLDGPPDPRHSENGGGYEDY